ncbi:MAG: XdhC family protein [Pirellulales bacterium]|nr:XdhC family protein [Pirellulales bacterium]
MRELLEILVDRLATGRPLACCRLVETRGSTPQKAGAMMLVFPDGAQAGTLGGGCVEAEVKRRALGILAGGRAEVITFMLDSDYGWDDGLICGGRMKVLVEPLADEAARSYYTRLHAMIAAGQGCVEALVFDAEKSGLAIPAAYLFDAAQQLVACCGQAAPDSVPEVLRENLPDLADRPRPQAAAGIAYLANLSRCRLVIVGAGHVGQAVANMAADVDFDVWAVDDRGEFASAERFPRAERLVVGPIERVLEEIEITPDTYCLIVTRGHNHDKEALYHLAERGARYVGMIGSRRKIKLIFDDLLNEGVSAEALARVFAPVGIDIGSQTVPEIAVSIVAELIAHRNRGVVPGRMPAVPVVEAS